MQKFILAVLLIAFCAVAYSVPYGPVNYAVDIQTHPGYYGYGYGGISARYDRRYPAYGGSNLLS